MLQKKKFFRGLEVLHGEGIYISGDIVEVLLESIDLNPSGFSIKGEPLYHKQHVVNLISSLPLETIHRIVKEV